MYKLFFSFLLAALLLTSPMSASAHNNGDGHTSYKPPYIECQGQKVSRLRMLIMRIFQNKVYLECLRDGTISIKPNFSPTPTPYPSASAIVQSSPSSTPSSTPTPNSSSTPTPSITLGSTPYPYWHEPGKHDGLNVHEHGDKPPTWADDFSNKNFGHPVMFGGDEATPNENIMKHQAYKGFLMHVSGVDVYIRYHNMSNPHDRSGAFHSYEVYAKDSSNNVSFEQGWMFYGYPENRSMRMTRRNEEPGLDPFNGINWPGRAQFIISSPDLVDWKNYLNCEQWYGHGGLWSWDVSVTICGASTFFTVDEYKTNVSDPSTWKPTGDVGGSRRLEVSHYGPANPNVGGENLPFDHWFCAKKQPNENRQAAETPTWDITGAVANPASCPEGWLPEYVASTFPKAGVYFQTGNTAEKDFPTPGVTIPN